MFRYEYIYVDANTGEILNLNKNIIKRDYDEYSDTWSKASYLYQAICDCNSDDDKEEKLNQIRELLKQYGVECEFEPDKDKEWGDGYIDHADETSDFVKAVLSDGEKLVKYLFGNSIIVTGNDNGDGYNDRMYVNEGEEVTNYGTYTNYGGLKPEFEDYEVFEKGN